MYKNIINLKKNFCKINNYSYICLMIYSVFIIIDNFKIDVKCFYQKDTSTFDIIQIKFKDIDITDLLMQFSKKEIFDKIEKESIKILNNY